jgi:Amt family ammonium transporter
MKSERVRRWVMSLAMGVLIAGTAGSLAQEAAPAAPVAAEAATAPEALKISVEGFTVNNVWMMVSTFLVFIMHLGFATVESGLTRAKNTVNILFKNTLIPALGLLTYAVIGFNLMYPGDSWIAGKFLGFSGLGLSMPENGGTSGYNVGYTYWTDFLFQGMFAATAATIVSGAVCERIKLSSFLLFSTIYVAFIYPIAGSWKWGLGWLNDMGFHDFAGSTLVHSVGGWGALAGAILLGPRLGKYVNGGIKPIMGHNLPMVTIGVFLLWLGWFGFNGGSVLSADPAGVSFVLVTTSIAAAAGVVTAMMTSWFVQKKPDLTMVLNGCLAGLVGITAGADVVSVGESVLIGGVAGVLVVFAVLFFDRIRIDDPVGAISVHLVCGVWGTLAAGIFGTGKSLGVQAIGVLAYGAFCFVAALAIFAVLKATIGLRVSREEEILGLDLGEHGMEAYPDFQGFLTK